MSESPCMLQGSAVAWDTSFCVSLKEYAPVANGKQQKLKKIAGIVRSSFLFLWVFFFFCGNVQTRRQFHKFIKASRQLFEIYCQLKSSIIPTIVVQSLICVRCFVTPWTTAYSSALYLLYGPAIIPIHDYWENRSFQRWGFSNLNSELTLSCDNFSFSTLPGQNVLPQKWTFLF